MNPVEFAGFDPVKELDVSIRVPGSKSLTNRVLLVAALAKGASRVDNVLFADDTRRMLAALQSLGVSVEIDEPAATVRVIGRDGDLSGDGKRLDIGNAGTAMRFLLGVLCASSGSAVLTGDGRMQERPIGDLVESLRLLGAEIDFETHDGYPPVRIRGKSLRGGSTTLRAERSSQYLSALLLCAPLAEAPVSIEVEGPLVSRPYIDLTLGVMRSFGVVVTEEPGPRFLVQAPQGYRARDVTIECDASSASYFLAAAAIAGGRVVVEGIGSKAQQGDVGFARVLGQMGCTVEIGEDSIAVVGPERLDAIRVDMNEMPDVAVTLAPVAAFANGTTIVTNVANLRIKESDRIAAICTELGKTGITARPRPDGFEIVGGVPGPAAISTYHDHRIAMAFALLGLRTKGIRILDPGCVEKTFPGYFRLLERVVASGAPFDEHPEVTQ